MGKSDLMTTMTLVTMKCRGYLKSVWEESFEATLATTASPIGKRETPWRPVLGMHISRDP
jgi:hypothetical protein